MKQITIYTDGSCYWKTKEGGFAVFFKESNKVFRQGWTNTSTDRMEIMALLFALKKLPNESMIVRIVIDNEYVVKTIREGWIYAWKHDNWIDRKNADLWKQILHEIESKPLITLRVNHIKGHQKHNDIDDVLYNNLVDRYANYKNFKNQKRYVDKDK